jgi:hypothetical protein
MRYLLADADERASSRDEATAMPGDRLSGVGTRMGGGTAGGLLETTRSPGCSLK